jgi:hypothetical protein
MGDINMTHQELLTACKMHGFELTPKTIKEHNFIPIVRFERGLGAEYVNLKSIKSTTIFDAMKQAEEEAVLYFKSNLSDAVIKEVRLKINNGNYDQN